jgi:hypothetical protein
VLGADPEQASNFNQVTPCRGVGKIFDLTEADQWQTIRPQLVTDWGGLGLAVLDHTQIHSESQQGRKASSEALSHFWSISDAEIKGDADETTGNDIEQTSEPHSGSPWVSIHEGFSPPLSCSRG